MQIVVHGLRKHPGYYEARCGDRVLAHRTKVPVVVAAKALLAEGVPEAEPIEARYATSSIAFMRSTVGEQAAAPIRINERLGRQRRSGTWASA